VNAKRESRTCDVGRAFGKCQVKLLQKEGRRLNQPGISGDAYVGTELGLTPAGWIEEPTSLGFAWTSDGASIPSAEAATYTVAVQDFGRWLACR
jgi:hypothetical protein